MSMASRSTAGLGYVSPISGINGGGSGVGNACITSLSDSGTVESHRYYLARRTALEMLRDRGCIIDDSEITRSLADFRSVFGDKPDPEKLTICSPLSSKPSKKILVLFCGPVEINKAKAVHILTQIFNMEGLHRIILLLESKMNHFAQKEFDKSKVKVEIFPIAEFLVNITKHVSVPRHQILTSEEKKQLLKKHDLADNQLPLMRETDAIARYYGLEKKQVVKVTHNNALTGSIVTYRCVV